MVIKTCDGCRAAECPITPDADYDVDEDEEWLLARELADMAAVDAGELSEIDRLRSGLDKPVSEGSTKTTRAVCYAKFMQKVRRHCLSAFAESYWQCMRTGLGSINVI